MLERTSPAASPSDPSPTPGSVQRRPSATRPESVRQSWVGLSADDRRRRTAPARLACARRALEQMAPSPREGAIDAG
jgi:hypothetical protein